MLIRRKKSERKCFSKTNINNNINNNNNNNNNNYKSKIKILIKDFTESLEATNFLEVFHTTAR